MSDIVERLNKEAVSRGNNNDAAAEILRLRAENEKLRAALNPFADAAQHYCIWKEHDDYFVGGKHLKFGDLRAAAAALKETGDETST